MGERPKLKLKSAGVARDPRRKPVRAATAPHRKAAPEAAERRDERAPRPRRAGGPAQSRAEPRRADHRARGADDERRAQPPRGQAPRGARPGGERRDERERRPEPGRPLRARPTDRRDAAPLARPRRDERGGERRDDRAAPRRRDEPPARERPPRHGGGAAPRQPPRGAATPARAETRRPAAQRAAAPLAAGEGVRVSKKLTDDGIASRREADEWIAAGWVRVDGRIARLGQRVLPGQRIDIDPAARRSQARRVTILLHKPLGYVSGQPEDGHPSAATLVRRENHWAEDPTRVDFQPGHARGLAPAGRLDIDSTGLLVLTQDGRVAKALIGDDAAVEKEYLVRVEPLAGAVPDDVVERLRHGLELDGRALKPARVSWANEDRLRIVLREGRKRQIRRMCELVGLKVIALKRIRIGRIALGALPPGQWRYLGELERF